MSTAAKVGGGLVEISAVATIIGAPTAEMLIHGLKGACGMAWAPMSAFGAIHVTKACLAAAVPDFLREASGLRNAHVDNAIGIAVRVDPRRRAKNRVDLGDAYAVQVVSPNGKYDRWQSEMGEVSHRPSLTVSTASSFRWVLLNKLRSINAPRIPNCVYVLDRSARLALDTVYASNFEQGEAIKIHRFEPDLGGMAPAWKDWMFLFASAIKLLEAFALWKLHASRLYYWTCIGWAHAFVSAIILQLCGLGRDNILLPSADIVAGTLPSPLHLGGKGKIVLQVPSNVRRHFLWKVCLGLGIFFNSAGLLGTFLYLGKETSTVIYTWVGFQILWLLSRTIVYYFVEGAAAARQGVMISTTWDEASDDDRTRVLNLLGDLSKHQVSIHPRGVPPYRQDCLDFMHLSSLFAQVNWQLTQEVPRPGTQNLVWKITVKAVAGDPVVRSAVWFTGTMLDNSELYDATIAFVSLDDQILAVPCVRVWSCDCLPTPHSSRGNAHPDCGLAKWIYFIPFFSANEKGWLLAYGHSSVGLLMTELLTDEEIDTRFKQGRYRISIQSVEDLNRALEVARNGAIVTRDLLKSATEHRQRSSVADIRKSVRTTSVEIIETPTSPIALH